MQVRVLEACALLLLVVLGACNGPGQLQRDAAVDTDTRADAFEKPMADAPGPPDAYVTYSPECTTAPATLLDASPRAIGDLALSGNVLYLSASEHADTGDVTNSVILSIDLMTGDQAYAPVVTAGDAALVAVGNDVYASVAAGGTILRLHPGVATETLITGRPSAGAVTADATHLYWSEKPTPADSDVIKRRLISGGTVEGVTTCNQAMQLFVVGTELYCMPFTGSVLRVAKDGSGQLTGISTNNYPIVSTIFDGSDFYLAGFSVYPQLHRMPLPAGPLAKVHEGAVVGRFTGLAATSTHFYVTHMDHGIRRFRRSDLATTLIATDYVSVGDAVVWNGHLYYATASFTDADQHRLRHCVD